MTSVFWNSARAVLMFAALVAVAPVPGDALAATPNAADTVIAAASVDRGLLAPSVSYAVVRNGALADGVAHGFADVEHNVPATPATRYAIGSITKMVTATAVMQLVSAGRLKLTDHLDTYLPWYQHADRITIEQLLQHTSGVHDYIDDIAADVRSGKAPPPPATARDLIDRIASLPLDFTPGTKFGYSNTGFMLLGLVVEHISGKSLNNYEQTYIFGPAGMSETTAGWPDANQSMAVAYGGAGQIVATIDPHWLYGCGDLVSTARDLARFDIALMGGKLVPAATFLQMQTDTFGKAPEGSGLGLIFDTFGSVTVVGHPGGVLGFRGENMMLPSQRLAVIALGNSSQFQYNGVIRPLLSANLPAIAKDARSKPGGNPDQSRTLRKFLDDMQKGNVDRSLFSKDLADAMIPRITRSFTQMFNAFGPVQATVFTGRFGGESYYDVIFADARWSDIYFDKDGKLGGL